VSKVEEDVVVDPEVVELPEVVWAPLTVSGIVTPPAVVVVFVPVFLVQPLRIKTSPKQHAKITSFFNASSCLYFTTIKKAPRAALIAAKAAARGFSKCFY
jgi:hypothetical protein